MIYKPLSVLPDNDYIAEGRSIPFSWKTSGDMMYAFRIHIYNNASGEHSYDTGEITSYTPKHTVTQNLPIGEYKYSVTVYNAIASVSDRGTAESEYKIFHIVSSPTVTLNLNNNDTITTQELSISANYSHPQGTKQKHYQFLLFDSDKNIIERSPYLTNSNFEYTYSTSLENNTSYYAQCIVTTYDGIEAGSAQIKFTAAYIKPSLNFDLAARTFQNEPYALISWSVTRIIGEIEGQGYFVDDNNIAVGENLENAVKLNLQSKDAKAVFDKAFRIDDDFTLNLWVEGFTEDLPFFTLKSIYGTIYLTYYSKKIHAFKSNSLYVIHICSEEINYTGAEQIMIRLQQKGKYLNIYAKIQ